MSVNEYLEKARRHEAQEGWGEALHLYERAISTLSDEGNPDPSLYGRAGDLQLRLGRAKAAADSYEQAIELYIRVMDLDGAFAVCQKILRHLPDLEEVYLRIARIRSMQGYTEWARQHYLTYAQIKGAKGDRDEAVRALEELLAAVPDDVDTRVFVAERLVAEGRRVDALEHLKEGYRRSVAANDRKAGQRLRERIYLLDPHAGLSELPGTEADDSAPSTVRELVQRPPTREKKSGSLGRLLGALGLGRPTAARSSDVDAARGEAPPAWASEEEEEAAAGATPVAQTDGRTSGAEPEPREEYARSEEYARLEEYVQSLGPSPSHAPEREEALAVPPAMEPAAPASALSWEQPAAEAEEDPLAAEEAEVLRLLAEEPFEVKHHERFVRYAAKRGEQDLLIEGLFHMAIALRAAGLEWRAKSTLARILSMDASNTRALEALGYGQPGAANDPFLRPLARPAVPATEAAPPEVLEPAAALGAAAPATLVPEGLEFAKVGAVTREEPAVPAEGYVDLGAMILDDVPEPSTRWQVEFEEPAPNQEADFAAILAQFKDQVSQHLERSDARAHYDLGSAYKGMGLVHEAIAMFQKALRAEPDFLPAIEMLGRCFLDNGEADAGIKVLTRGLQVNVPVEDDLLGVYYYLGNAHEMQGDAEGAKDYYMKVFARDINFIDVTERLRTLR